MSKAELTEAQREALSDLGDPSVVNLSAYAMGCSMSTLWSLASRGLVKALHGPGSVAFPRNMMWRITEAGRAALSQETNLNG